jgi:hypothetical protein
MVWSRQTRFDDVVIMYDLENHFQDKFSVRGEAMLQADGRVVGKGRGIERQISRALRRG